MTVILWKILVFVFVLGVLIFIHELGHFLVAKWCRVGVVKFAVGFGPAIFKFRRNETEYAVCWIPLGGYVRMVGDMPDIITGKQDTDEEVRKAAETNSDPSAQFDRSRWFIEKNLWQRSAIVFAGPLFNFLLAFVLVGATVWFVGEDIPQEDAIIGTVMERSPAAQGGLAAGDLVVSLNGEEVSSWTELATSIHESDGNAIELVVQRSDELLTLSIQPKQKEVRDHNGKLVPVHLIGVGQKFESQEAGIGRAIQFGAMWTYHATLKTYQGLWGMISGDVSPKDLAGPVFIFDAASKQAEKGFQSLLFFISILSVSLAVLNLLPIPILDGGHLLFFFLEAVFGPMSIRKKEFAQQVGMALLLVLMVFAIHNDFSRDPGAMNSEISWGDEQP